VLRFWVLGFLGLSFLGIANARSATVGELRCESREDPLGIDVVSPRLSWTISSQRRGEHQSAYRVLVASSPDALARDVGDLWDSGRVASPQSYGIEYAGKPLASRTRCLWKARVWDRDEKATAWSAPARWSMGLLNREDWQADWIGYDAAYQTSEEKLKEDRLLSTRDLSWIHLPATRGKSGVFEFSLRKQINLPADRKLRRAVLVLYAHNLCLAWVNQTPVGRSAWWEKTARLDVTAQLHPGDNVVALTVENTDFYPPAVIGQLVLQYESGDDMKHPVNTTWRLFQKPPSGWDKLGYDDDRWGAPDVLTGTPWGTPSLNDIDRLPAPYLRGNFKIEKPIRHAEIYVTALGCYELHLNGQRVGQDELTPGWTDFRKRVQYQTYDVTYLVKPGANAIGAILGDGWFASDLAFVGRRKFYGGDPRLSVQLVVELADGSLQTVASNGDWKAATGPIRHADLLLGCEYDARLQMDGWDQPGFDDSSWKTVDVNSGPSGVVLQAASAEALRRHEELTALAVKKSPSGSYIFDLGQNMVGWVRLKVHGKPGQRITVRHGEMLNPDGTLYTINLRGAIATDFFELAGKGEETLEPHFTFHGFRYVELLGLDYPPETSAVTGIVVHTPMRRAGHFECSHPLVNKLFRNIVWGQKGNYFEVPTDCPQRDERMGWTGDTQFFAPTAAYNFDVQAFFTRWLVTMCDDSQHPDGSFAHVSPDMGLPGSATAWGDAALLCTYNTYRVYGDKRVIRDHFAAMEKYMDFVAARSKDFVPKIGGFGDWLNLGGSATPEVIDTAYYAHLARIMAEMSRAIDKPAQAERYAALADQVRKRFAAFFHRDGALIGCSQTGYALAFTMDLVPPELREKAAAKFADEVRRTNWHLATGFIGTPRLLPGLHAAGRDDVAYKLLLQESYPSWLFQVKLGATTMWERWDGWTPERGFQTIQMNSFNHYAFGSVGEYLYSVVGGIRAESPGYDKIRIEPVPGAGLTWAEAMYRSNHGPIATLWKRTPKGIELSVVVPPNTIATVYVPAADANGIIESGKPVAQAEGVKFVRMEKKAAVFEVGSGNYVFSVK
jgi:alpha-L-rhamnosidase